MTMPLLGSDFIGLISYPAKSETYGTSHSKEGTSASGFSASTTPAGSVVVDAEVFKQLLANQNPSQTASQTQVKSQSGTCTFTNGSEYTGQMKDSIPHGTGKLTYGYSREQTRLNYIGQFENGLPHGQGTMRFKNGAVFEGFMDRGACSDGRLTYSDGGYYVGTFQGEIRWTGIYYHSNREIPHKIYREGKEKGMLDDCCVIL